MIAMSTSRHFHQNVTEVDLNEVIQIASLVTPPFETLQQFYVQPCLLHVANGHKNPSRSNVTTTYQTTHALPQSAAILCKPSGN